VKKIDSDIKRIVDALRYVVVIAALAGFAVALLG
jgi:hypothetical protein